MGCMKEHMGESADALIASAASEDFTITKADLARWHRAGLLPRPQRHSLGRPHGMVSIYPPGTSRQVLALCRIHQSEKRLAYIAWCLWWEGYAIPVDLIRQFLEKTSEGWQQGLEEVRQVQRDPERLTKLLDRSSLQRLSQKPLRGVRKRVGRDDFPVFLGVILRIASGTFEGYVVDEERGIDERAVVEKGFGLLRARTNRLADAEPWLTGETDEVFRELSSRLRDHPLGEDLAVIPEEALRQTREELRSFLSAFEGISRTMDRMFSRGAFGFTVLADAIRAFGPQDQAMMLLFWRMVQSWGLGPNLDGLVAVAQQWHEVWFPLFQGLEQLRAEVPETAAVLAPKQMGFALRWKLTMEWVLDVARQFSQQPDVQAFFARHPDLVEAMERDAQKSTRNGKAAE